MSSLLLISYVNNNVLFTSKCYPQVWMLDKSVLLLKWMIVFIGNFYMKSFDVLDLHRGAICQVIESHWVSYARMFGFAVHCNDTETSDLVL